MSLLIEFLGRILLEIFFWAILFPITWIVCTPFILIISAFRPRPFFASVSNGYKTVTNFWSTYGTHLLPF
jgi:hypothetical protein